jgi:hypothetical protein
MPNFLDLIPVIKVRHHRGERIARPTVRGKPLLQGVRACSDPPRYRLRLDAFRGRLAMPQHFNDPPEETH